MQQPPRVNPLLRVESNTDDPPDLEDEIEVQEIEQNAELCKPGPPPPPPRQNKHKSTPSTNRVNSRYFLRDKPQALQRLLAYVRSAQPSKPALLTAEDLRVSKEIFSKMHVTNHETPTHQEPYYRPILDDHPTELLSQYAKTRECLPRTQELQSLNAVYDPTSGAYLEYRELLKTKEKNT